MLREEPLRPQSVVLFYRAQHISTGHAIPGHHVLIPPGLLWLGFPVGDVINTGDEVRGMMQERLYVDSPPLGSTGIGAKVLCDAHGRGAVEAKKSPPGSDKFSYTASTVSGIQTGDDRAL